MKALVTGGSSGLGAALVAALVGRGDEVLVCDVNDASGADHFLRLDVRSDDDWESARAWVESQWGGLDVLVNNAGVAGGGRIELTSMDAVSYTHLRAHET